MGANQANAGSAGADDELLEVVTVACDLDLEIFDARTHLITAEMKIAEMKYSRDKIAEISAIPHITDC